MRKLVPLLFLEAIVLVALVPIFSIEPGRTVIAQASFPDPATTTRSPSAWPFPISPTS